MILFKKIHHTFLMVLVLTFSFISCATTVAPQAEVANVDLSAPLLFDNATAEREGIFALAAYVVVYKDWQTVATTPRRGHNIGSILVTPNNVPVAWGRNCIAQTNDGTQHGEVQLMQNYIDEHDTELLDKYTIYTTLEPCAMCSGMMSLVKVAHCVYGQNDGDALRVGYGRAIERLQLDSSSLPNGYKPYPRTPETSKAIDLPHRKALDNMYNTGSESSITEFLLSDAARKVYADANDEFYNFVVAFEKNQDIYDATKKLVDKAVSGAD